MVGPSILLSAEDKRGLCKTLAKSFDYHIKLLGRKISYTYLCTRLKELWSLHGITDLDHGFYCVRFSKQKDYDFVLPWLIADHCLSVRRWTPYFRSSSATIDKVAAQIRRHMVGLPYCEAVGHKYIL